MNTPTLFKRLFFALLLLPPLLVGAQTDPEAEHEPEPEVNVHFSIYVWPAAGIMHEGSDVPGVPRVFYHGPTGMQQVPLSRGAASPLMEYRGPLPLEFFDAERIVTPPPEEAPPGAEPVITYRTYPVMSVEFPREWNQVLFLTFPHQRQADGTLLTLPVRYDVDRVRPGYVRIYNSTSTNLICEIEGREFPLPAHSPLDFRPEQISTRSAHRVNFHGRDRQGEVRMLYTTRLVARDATSNLYFLYSRDSRRFRMLRVGGHEPPPTPTPVPTPAPQRR